MEDGAKPGDPYGGTNKWLKESVKRTREQDEATPVEEPSAKRAETAGKRKGRKGTFRKKGGNKIKPEPATQAVKAVDAFTSKVYAYEARLIGFDKKGELVQIRESISRFWMKEYTESTGYTKPNVEVSDNERNSIKDKFNYVAPEGVTVTWEDMLVADLKENKDSLLVDFIRFVAPEVRAVLAVEKEAPEVEDVAMAGGKPLAIRPRTEEPTGADADDERDVPKSEDRMGDVADDEGIVRKPEDPIVIAFLKAKIMTG
jgi:hypothetical protein